MTMTDVAFYLLSGFAIWTGWRVFRVDSMIRATFLLLLSFTSVGLIGLLLSASYLGAATIFMMAVEMMVMGLFMVMFMMNPAGLNPMMMVHQHRLSIVAGLLIFAAMTGAVLLTPLPSDPVAADRPVLRDLGIELLGDSMLIFETAGVTRRDFRRVAPRRVGSRKAAAAMAGTAAMLGTAARVAKAPTTAMVAGAATADMAKTVGMAITEGMADDTFGDPDCLGGVVRHRALRCAVTEILCHADDGT